MPWYYAAADAMIVTSVREGGPSSVKEALACGIPVVSVAVGDTELFRETPSGMVCAEASPESLAGSLRDTLERHRGKERRSLLPPGLTIGEAAQAVTAVYREVISDARRGASHT